MNVQMCVGWWANLLNKWDERLLVIPYGKDPHQPLTLALRLANCTAEQTKEHLSHVHLQIVFSPKTLLIDISSTDTVIITIRYHAGLFLPQRLYLTFIFPQQGTS